MTSNTDFDIYSDGESEYNTFMENLSPCSSIVTAFSNSPVEYNPINVANLLQKRNGLSKSGTLTDDSKVSKFELEDDDCGIKILCTDGDSFVVKLELLKHFINKYSPKHKCSIEQVSIYHLLIYISNKYNVGLNTIKLCHLGKSYNVKTIQDLCTKKKSLLNDLKIQQFPTMHLLLTNAVSLDISMSCAVEKTFEDDFYAVTYVEAIAHKMSVKRKKFKGLRRLLKV